MSAFVWLSADNKTKYMTSRINDPIPLALGYTLTSGSDGAPDAALKTFDGGLASGGYPSYDGPDGYKTAANATHPNGLLGGGNR